MLTNYFTLRSLAEELNRELRGAAIRQVFTQHKNELLVFVARPLNREQAGSEFTLTISVDPKNNFIFLREGASRARRNSVDLFAPVIPSEVASVSIRPHDRAMFIETSIGMKICPLLYGTAEANVVLVDEHGIIRDAFKHSKQLAGKRLKLVEPPQTGDVLSDTAQFRSAFLKDVSTSTFAALKSLIPTLGSTLAREILHRANAEEKAHLDHLGEADVEAIHTEALRLLSEVASPKPCIYFREADPSVFSIVALKHLAGSHIEYFDSVNEAARTFVLRSFHIHAVDTLKKDLLKKINNELERTERAMRAVDGELAHADRAEDCEHTANVIMANIQHLTRGTKAVDIEDPFREGKLVRLTLDPRLSPVQNAEVYFAKAKKARAARAEAFSRSETLRPKHSRLETFLLHLDNCQTHEQIEEFQHDNAEELRAWNIISSEASEESLPFRRFTVTGGFEVWVGKSSQTNDLLTMKYAKPADLWFHVRGAGGSHTVLKMGGGKTKPSREAVRQAAAIAAYYSKMRKASAVPVAYCERKFVRKPKGAEPGTVMMEREKVVFVQPGLPG
jgi:predicted ribosome quality control (RQC) complex YloA/Tae2 family protein